MVNEPDEASARPIPAPNGWRLLAGFVLAPLLPALLLAGVALGDLSLLPLILKLVVWPGAALIGLPLYLNLRGWVWPTWHNFAAAGACAAVVPCIILKVLAKAGVNNYSWVDGRATIEAGRLTLYGWIVTLEIVGTGVLLGAAG
jgi:hypothetical protein